MTLAVSLLHSELLSPPLETGKRNTLNQEKKKQGIGEKQMLVGLRARGRYMKGPNLKIRRGLVASVNTSHLSKENRIAKCLKWVT